MGSYSKQNKTKTYFTAAVEERSQQDENCGLLCKDGISSTCSSACLWEAIFFGFSISQFESILWISGQLTQAEETNRKPTETSVRTLGVQFPTKFGRGVEREKLTLGEDLGWTKPRRAEESRPALDSFTSHCRHFSSPGTVGWAAGWGGDESFCILSEAGRQVHFAVLPLFPPNSSTKLTKPFTVPHLSIQLSFFYGFLIQFFCQNALPSSSIHIQIVQCSKPSPKATSSKKPSLISQTGDYCSPL